MSIGKVDESTEPLLSCFETLGRNEAFLINRP
jgi:hypothetical protein